MSHAPADTIRGVSSLTIAILKNAISFYLSTKNDLVPKDNKETHNSSPRQVRTFGIYAVTIAKIIGKIIAKSMAKNIVMIITKIISMILSMINYNYDSIYDHI